MKRIIVLLILLILLIGCSNKDEKIIEEKESIKYSDRQQNIVDLLLDKMEDEEYLIKDKLDNIEVKEIYFDGYYKNEDDKNYYQIKYYYICKNNKNDCVLRLGSKSNKNNYLWICIDKNEKKIFDISTGISISKEDINNGNYVRVSEVIE